MTQPVPPPVDKVQPYKASPSGTDGLVARPILKSNDKQVLTYTRTTDARSALARGLREYLLTRSLIWEGGRKMQLLDVFITWAAPEDPAVYPSASLVGAQDAEYEAAEMTPKLIQIVDPKDKRYIRQVSELGQRFGLVIWTQDPMQRMGLSALIEDAMEPAEFMTGLRLELPYYFNARATYEKISLNYMDDTGSAAKRWRRATFTIKANVPQFVPVGDLVPMQPRHVVQAVEGDGPFQEDAS